jgi:hypothetical protein
VEAAGVTPLFELRLDLRARPVHEHELHAESGEQVQIVREVEETAVGDQVAAEGDDENLSAESVYVGGDRLEPVDEAVLAGKPLAARRLRPARAGVSPRLLVFCNRDGVLPGVCRTLSATNSLT